MDTLPAKPVSSASAPREPRRDRRQREPERSVHFDPSQSSPPNVKPKGKERAIPTGPRTEAQSTRTFPVGDDFVPFASADPSPSSSPPPLSEAEKKIQQRERDLRSGNERRRSPASRKAPWVSDVDWESCNNVAEMLHCEVEAFIKYISPTPIEDEVRGLVVKLIAKAVTTAFPDAQVLPFGSFETKLYLPLGDIDLVILSDSMAYSNKSNVLHALANTIKRAQLADKVTIIAKAKVPIIKFITSHGRFNVDISINQSNGITAGRIINGFLDNLQSIALRSLVMVTKTFLSQRSMNEVFTGGLGSYSIVCLAVSFLQMHPKIRKGEIDAEKNLGVLIIEFFELYGCYFNYEEVGISVRDGGTYFSKRQRGWLDFSRNHLLSIEDPADPSNDISRGTFAIAKVRATFAGAHGILTAAAYLRAGIISARREGRSSNLRGHYSPEDMSILSSVLGVTQETINHRKLVQEVYDKRTLHHMLGVSAKETVPSRSGVRTTPSARNIESSPSSERRAMSVKSAWEQAEYDPESDDGLSKHRRKKADRKRQKEEEEEEGRYDIQSQRSSKKRRKIGRRDDVHAAFTIDDEEGEIDEPLTEYVCGDSLDELEEGQYDLVTHDSSRRKDRDRVRSYWLSKAIAVGNGESD